MRIVGGAFRGRALQTPEGLDTRPTSDRARQAIFNILEHAPWSDGVRGKRVIDLFAGSGAMGLEALSRGAASCVFVERAEAACAAIRANVDALGVGDRSRLLRRDAGGLGPAPEAFTLAFLDPPYNGGLDGRALRALAAGGWLSGGAIAVVESAASAAAPQADGFELLDERRYGRARVSLLRFGGESGQ